MANVAGTIIQRFEPSSHSVGFAPHSAAQRVTRVQSFDVNRSSRQAPYASHRKSFEVELLQPKAEVVGSELVQHQVKLTKPASVRVYEMRPVRHSFNKK
jgi:hypothetical protein